MVYGRRLMVDGLRSVVDSRHCMVVGRWSAVGDRRWTVGGEQSQFRMTFDSLSAVEPGEPQLAGIVVVPTLEVLKLTTVFICVPAI